MQPGDFIRVRKDLTQEEVAAHKPPEFWLVLQAAANTNGIVVAVNDGMCKVHTMLGADWVLPESWLEKV